jgi:hypothetical protein
MNFDKDLLIFLTSWPGLDKSQVSVIVDDKYNAEISEDINFEIEKTWSKILEKNNRMYAQSKFRFGAMSDENGEINIFEENKKSKPENLILGIGLTDYKAFLGTNKNDKVIEKVTKMQNRNFLSDLIG